MRLSVVIPLYNKEQYVARAVESVLSQTVQDFEIIIVDDGSTDGGCRRVEEFKDPRVRIFRQRNAGVSAARNRGIEAAEADWIAFLDADDAWKPNYLETVSGMIERYPDAGAYATAYEIISSKGEVVHPRYHAIPLPPWQGLLASYFRSALGIPPVWTSATTVPKHVIHRLGGFPLGVPLGEDLDMWGRIALQYPIAFCNEVCASYIQEELHPGSRQHYYFTNSEAAFVRTAREAIQREEIDENCLEELHEYMAKLQIAVGYDCLIEGGNPTIARKILLQARPATLHLKWRKYRTLLQSCLPGQLLRTVYRKTP